MENKLIVEGNFDNKIHSDKKMCDAFGNPIILPDGYRFLCKISDGKWDKIQKEDLHFDIYGGWVNGHGDFCNGTNYYIHEEGRWKAWARKLIIIQEKTNDSLSNAVNYSANRILWLDDLRNPYINIEGRVPKENLIIDWVLNYEQFVQWVEKYGLPKIISFDHDLADEHYTPEEYWHDYQISKEYQDAQNYQEKTGMDCAKWLVNYCIDNQKQLPIFYVHSANPVGADNINGILNNYLKHCLAD